MAKMAPGLAIHKRDDKTDVTDTERNNQEGRWTGEEIEKRDREK